MLRNALLATLLLAAAVPASASIAVFTDGRSMKVEKFKAVEDSMQLTMKGGGVVTVPLARIDRVIDDEVSTPEVVAEVKKIIEEHHGIFPERSWRYNEASTPLFNSKFNATIVEAAKKFDVDAALVSAVIKAESDFNPHEVSNKGARGLMQLMPATARRLSVRRPFDPASNVNGGVRYLKELLERFDHRPELALAAYNAGENAVSSYGGVPPYRETIGYVKKILSWWTPAIAATVAPAGVASEPAAGKTAPSSR